MNTKLEKPKKLPVRTCCGCQEKASKKELVRVVRTPEGRTNLDPTGRANGRGAYVHQQGECFEKALKNRRLITTLKTELTADETARLRQELQELASGT